MNPSISDIKEATLAFYAARRITKADLEGQSKAFAISHPRQIAMYLTRALTTHSLPKIASSFGGRHHATCIHAIRAVEKRKKSLSDAEAIRRVLQTRTSPRGDLSQELAACRAVCGFIRWLPRLPVERDWILITSEDVT